MQWVFIREVNINSASQLMEKIKWLTNFIRVIEVQEELYVFLFLFLK